MMSLPKTGPQKITLLALPILAWGLLSFSPFSLLASPSKEIVSPVPGLPAPSSEETEIANPVPESELPEGVGEVLSAQASSAEAEESFLGKLLRFGESATDQFFVDTVGNARFRNITAGENIQVGGTAIRFDYHPDETAMLDFNKGGSDIRDDSNLWINTDDYLFFHAPTAIVVWSDALEFWPNLTQPTIDFKKGDSKIYDNGNLHIATDDYLYLDTNNETYLRIYSPNNALEFYKPENSSNADSKFWWRVGQPSSYTDVMVLDNDGNIGLGTNSPSEKLDVRGDALIRNAGATSTNAILNVISGNAGQSILKLGDTDDYDIGQISYDQTSNYMAFKTNDSERIRIDSSGNVGIGTASPNDKLEVSGAIRATGSTPSFTAADGIVIDIETTGGIRGRVAAIDADGNSSLAFETTSGGSTSEAMRIDSDGNVGIGTTDPQTNLEVTSTIRLTPTDSPPTCSSTIEGAIYYDDSENVLKYCNGTSWTNL